MSKCALKSLPSHWWPLLVTPVMYYIQTPKALQASLLNIQRSPGICCSWCGIDGFWAGVCLGPALEKPSQWGVVTLVI